MYVHNDNDRSLRTVLWLTTAPLQDHKDALALVHANKSTLLHQGYEPGPSKVQDKAEAHTNPQRNEDLMRAKELVDLHYEMKSKYRDGTVDDELAHLRDDVNRVLFQLDSIHRP